MGHSTPADDVLVEMDRATLSYGGRPALTNVSTRITSGQFAGLVGPSGAGKTTLLRAILGMVPRVQGTVRVLGREVHPGSSPAGIAYVPQLETVDWNFPVTVEEVV